MHQGKILLNDSPPAIFKQKELLEEIGLGVPFPLKIAFDLRKRGWHISDGCLTMDDLANEIAENVENSKMKIKEKAADSRQQAVDNEPAQISVNRISYLYDQGLPTARKALDQISFEIKKGDFIGLVGPTGSGKSTLVQHLNGLLFPSSGDVSIEGISLKEKNVDLKKIRQKVGLVFQFPELQLFENTVYDDIAFGPKNLNLPQKEIDSRIRESMEKVGLDFDRFAFRSPFSLSGGEQRKAAIAGILALKPEILVLDEPTCGLDAKSTREIKRLLMELNSAGVTMILISHNMDLIAQLAQKIILLDQGRLLAFCDKEEFFEDPDRIRSAGLDLPQVVELVLKLKQTGIKTQRQIFTQEELLAVLSEWS
jgi:energy-coupling factor transport system ATP-binding protein